jgi:hypothetical protein
MMKHKFSTITLGLILPVILALVSAFTWPTPALAQGPRGDQVVFGDNLVLEAEEKIEGDVLVFGGNVTMPASSQIDGDLVVFGGNADVDGTVTGDIGMIGGNINLGKTAVVKGDIGFLGGNADIAEGAKVEGDVTSLNRFGWDHDEGFSVPPIPPVPPVSPVPPIPPVPPVPPVATDNHIRSDFFDWGGRVFDFFRYVVGNMALLLALAVLGWLVAAFMPEQMKVVGDTLVTSAPLSFGLGLLTSIFVTAIGGVLLITICLAFIPPVAFLLLGIATLFGWIVAGQVIGERLLMATGQPYSNFVVSTLLGVTALTLVATMPIIELIPCLGFLLSLIGGLFGIIVALTGLGAVILTRFGTQPYPPPAYAFPGGPSLTPAPGPATRADRPRPVSLAALERSEAELRAKIDAALAEADAAAAEEILRADEPAVEEAGAPETDQPSAEPTAGEILPPAEAKPAPKRKRRKAENDPEQTPKDDV